jgi:hypothetical protein
MSQTLPQTDSEIRNEFSDRGNYFSLMCAVNNARGGAYEAAWCRYARRVMLVLGYPAETASWDDARTIMYAQNIVMMG